MSNLKPTAKLVVLPDGVEVWVVSLNEYFKEEVQQEAAWFAQSKMRRFRPGGSDHEAFSEEWRGRAPLEHAIFLAEYDGWKGVYLDEVDNKLPLPKRPEIGSFKVEADFTDACARWEDEVSELNFKRREMAESLAQKAIENYTKKPAKWRREQCMQADFSRQFSQLFAKRASMETVYRATRTAENQLRFHYPSVDQVIAESDEVHKILLDAYEEVDPYKPEDVPTSPDVS